jgi:hypothetical protein
MNWTDLKNTIYYWDGSWRDIYVHGTNMTDWKKWTDYVNANYKVDWFNGKTNKNEARIDFSVIEEYWNGNHDFCSTAKVLMDTIQINAHFFVDKKLENDIDPREFNSIDDHNKLLKFMTDLSILLDKQVILTPENDPETILIKVDRNKTEFAVNINPSLWKLKTR